MNQESEKTAPTTEQCLLAENMKLQNKQLELKGSFSDKEYEIDSLESDLADMENERDSAIRDVKDMEDKISQSTHTVFGEKVTIFSPRIDMGHFFETLAEVSKNYTPYQLEEMIKNLPR